MKKKYIVVILTIAAIFCSGCGSELKITDEESYLIAEYMSELLLKHDKNYTNKLILNEEDKGEKKDNETENTIKDDKDMQQTTSNNANSSDKGKVLGNGKINVSVSSAKLYSSYPETGAYIVNAKDKYKILKLGINLKNKNDSTQNIDISSENISCTFETSNGSRYKALITFLDNELQLLQTSIGANSSYEAVLLFEVPSETDIKNSSLIITNGSNTSTISVN